ncbi:hypothetical protein C9374_004034 [Naegleria lovaniensis]|uniref:GST N-terminal domain-containing protein n=1 Tax=Naegleria lovaniensis TaxID=51637 RepID=A0AA88KYR2_NAELO|nr:uncharacterized protein C9374_004034 [Naegleria lovaniensis]KAG2394270.1 hypothetical protein C9374_004034 [Naegleria lovaniensis]
MSQSTFGASLPQASTSFEYLKLYVSFPTRSIKVLWVLNELKLPLKFQYNSQPVHVETHTTRITDSENHLPTIEVNFLNLEKGDHLHPEMNPHPFLKVPTLVFKLKGNHEEQALFESNAIIFFLLDHFQQHSKLTQLQDSQSNANRYKYVFWTNSSFEIEAQAPIKLFKALVQKKNLNMSTKSQLVLSQEEQEEFDEKAKIISHQYLPYLEKELSQRDSSWNYLLGNEFDVADICIGFCLSGIDTCMLLKESVHPKCFEYFHKYIRSRESFQWTMKQLMTLYSKNFESESMK